MKHAFKKWHWVLPIVMSCAELSSIEASHIDSNFRRLQSCAEIAYYPGRSLNGSRLCFFGNQASERGTEQALFDYADFSQKLLGAEVSIMFPRYILGAQPNLRHSLYKFQNRFAGQVFFCGDSFEPEHIENPPSPLCANLSQVAKNVVGCDMIYALKYGPKEWEPVYPASFNDSLIPTAFHAVFLWGQHGTTYAAISDEAAWHDPKRAVVPHLVRMPDPALVKNTSNLRGELGIPEKAYVFCRHGGDTTFDMPYAAAAVLEILTRHSADRLHFIFLGTPSFSHKLNSQLNSSPHSDKIPLLHKTIKAQVHFLKATTDDAEKERYFKSCDAMLHAGFLGETFGLAIAEFAVRNKPVLTQEFVGNNKYKTMHIEILKDKAFYYRDKNTLVALMDSLVVNGTSGRSDFLAYDEYSPSRVMQKFKKVFLDPIFGLSC